jgi:phosphoribosylanthranilate isomerase
VGATRIKICGITSGEHLIIAAEAGADAIGLVQAPSSPRALTRSQAATLAAQTPGGLTPVTLLANADAATLRHRPCQWVQLHGQEDLSDATAAATGGPVIRALPFDDREAITRWDQCQALKRLLIDSPRGGSGIAFDHAAFAEFASTIRTPWILAGGLTPDTVTAAIECLRPWGVDVSSGVESSRGIKDPAMIIAFCQAVRAAD